jgi:hypothetical protein
MRKLMILAGLVAALAIPATAAAAILHEPHQNVFTCSAGGTWHFVQNQTGGSQVNNTLTAQFSGGNVVALQDKVTPGGTYHWTISGTGTLITASTTVAAGNLVLSDFSCNPKKPPPKK